LHITRDKVGVKLGAKRPGSGR